MMMYDKKKPNQEQIIALIGFDDTLLQHFKSGGFEDRQVCAFKNGLELSNQWENNHINIVAVIAQSEILGTSGIALLETFKKRKYPNVPFFIVCNPTDTNIKLLAIKSGVSDIFILPVSIQKVQTRINFLINNWENIVKKSTSDNKQNISYKTPLAKRIFDLFFAGTALICLSPFLLLIYILIRLESNGPVFYYALRVGTGYKIFKFYKFRSMYVNADQRLKDLKHLNQYASTTPTAEEIKNENFLCDECLTAGTKCQFPIYADKVQWCEKDYIGNKKGNSGAAFFKIKDDPRITKVGKFIRNTSIDELPQLWNVIIGDMSIVGNRPLPLYESEKLTTDKYSQRFMAPAGITGLWQVEKRGSAGEMSEEERLMLDNKYAENHSFLYDIKLIFRTIPALFQKENV